MEPQNNCSFYAQTHTHSLIDSVPHISTLRSMWYVCVCAVWLNLLNQLKTQRFQLQRQRSMRIVSFLMFVHALRIHQIYWNTVHQHLSLSIALNCITLHYKFVQSIYIGNGIIIACPTYIQFSWKNLGA